MKSAINCPLLRRENLACGLRPPPLRACPLPRPARRFPPLVNPLPRPPFRPPRAPASPALPACPPGLRPPQPRDAIPPTGLTCWSVPRPGAAARGSSSRFVAWSWAGNSATRPPMHRSFVQLTQPVAVWRRADAGPCFLTAGLGQIEPIRGTGPTGEAFSPSEVGLSHARLPLSTAGLPGRVPPWMQGNERSFGRAKKKKRCVTSHWPRRPRPCCAPSPATSKANAGTRTAATSLRLKWRSSTAYKRAAVRGSRLVVPLIHQVGAEAPEDAAHRRPGYSGIFPAASSPRFRGGRPVQARASSRPSSSPKREPSAPGTASPEPPPLARSESSLVHGSTPGTPRCTSFPRQRARPVPRPYLLPSNRNRGPADAPERAPPWLRRLLGRIAVGSVPSSPSRSNAPPPRHHRRHPTYGVTNRALPCISRQPARSPSEAVPSENRRSGRCHQRTCPFEVARRAFNPGKTRLPPADELHERQAGVWPAEPSSRRLRPPPRAALSREKRHRRVPAL